jgi:CshA-type fibril repeat protein
LCHGFPKFAVIPSFSQQVIPSKPDDQLPRRPTLSARRLVPAFLLLPVLVAGTVTGTAVTAAAAAASDPTVAVTTGGSPAASVAAGDTMAVTQTAPITLPGQTSQTLEATWDPQQATLPASGITRPDGWSLDYTTDGSTWSATAPSDLSSVAGVRSTGNVESNGISGGLQVSTATGAGTLQPGGSSFSGSSGGDGWDVFFTRTQVLNVWHHQSNRYNLDCHLRSTGASCATPVYGINGYQTANGSSGTALGDKVYSAVGENASSSIGVLCTDTSTIPFTSCGYTTLVPGSAAYSNIGTQSRLGDRLFVPVATTTGGKLACFDLVAGATCPGQPYAFSGFSRAPAVPAFSFADSGRVFVTANKIWCFDGAGTPCAGSWPAGSYAGTVHSAVPQHDAGGALTGVCMILPAGNCFDLLGAATTMPAALVSLLAAKPVGGFAQIGYGQYGFTSTQQYWFSSAGYSAPAVPVCWDWATDSACAGFQTTTPIQTLRYAIVVDPLNDTCLWSNGDNGAIAPFSAVTGAPGCAASDPAVVIPYTTAVPRLSCDEVGRLRGWQSVTVSTPAGLSATSLRVTVRNTAGASIPAYVDLTPDSGGVIDLSALPVATSGTQPSLKIRAVGATDAQAQAITAAVRYTSDPPQLCVQLRVAQQCPTARAVYPTPTVPVSDLPIGGTATASTGGSSTTTSLATAVSRADMTGCLGGAGGTVTRTAGGSSTPIRGATVRLLGPGGATIATTSTDPSGAYSFPNTVPAGYIVRALGQDQSVTVAAGSTASADFAVAVGAPTANPVHASTLQNSPATVGIDATADPAATIDLATVLLSDGSGWVSSLTVPGEGTWDVVAGNLRFTPLVGFTGNTTDVTYGVSDSFGARAQSSASVDVAAVLPTASAIEATGVRGDTLTLVPAGRSSAVPIDPASIRLVDPSTGSAVTTMTVPGTGTYRVDTATGHFSFVPAGDFVGAHTVVYRVTDVTGRPATAVARVTITPFALTSGQASVQSADPASVQVAGIPAGSRVTVPAGVAGASAVGVAGGVVSVTPRPDFTGTITVPVTVVHGTATVVHDVVVFVHPRPAGAGSWTFGQRGAVVTWAASPTSSVSAYRVFVRGKLVCTTTATSCAYPRLVGARSRVRVEAVGGGGLVSEWTLAPYHFTRCLVVRDVHFGTSSAELKRGAKRHLRAIATRVRAGGFAHVCLVGHTDSRGTPAYNKALSKRRVHAVRHRLGALVRRVHVATVAKGERDPLRSNSSKDGRKSNRRVTVGIG